MASSMPPLIRLLYEVVLSLCRRMVGYFD